MLSLDLFDCVTTIKQYVMMSSPETSNPTSDLLDEKTSADWFWICICDPFAATKPEDAAKCK